MTLTAPPQCWMGTIPSTSQLICSCMHGSWVSVMNRRLWHWYHSWSLKCFAAYSCTPTQCCSNVARWKWMLKQVVTFTPVLLSSQILFLAVVSSCQAATPWKMTRQKLGRTGAKGMVTHQGHSSRAAFPQVGLPLCRSVWDWHHHQSNASVAKASCIVENSSSTFPNLSQTGEAVSGGLGGLWSGGAFLGSTVIYSGSLFSRFSPQAPVWTATRKQPLRGGGCCHGPWEHMRVFFFILLSGWFNSYSPGRSHLRRTRPPPTVSYRRTHP